MVRLSGCGGIFGDRGPTKICVLCFAQAGEGHMGFGGGLNNVSGYWIFRVCVFVGFVLGVVHFGFWFIGGGLILLMYLVWVFFEVITSVR